MSRPAHLLGVCMVVVSMSSCSLVDSDFDQSARPDVRVNCEDLAERRSLRALTINLQFSEIRERGVLAGTRSTALDLHDLLRDRHGLVFDSRTALEDGVPGLLTVANAVLSRCPVLDMRTAALPEIAELEVLGGRFRLGRNVVMVRLLVPEVGEIGVYDTHLCARCTAEQRRRQLAAALAFVTANEDGGARPVIFGGDLNLDIHRDARVDRALYDLILHANLRDTATANIDPVEQLCAQPAEPDAYCTVGVAKPIRPHSRRIDYLFVRNVAAIAVHRVVFNPRIDPTQPAVSNHAGVLAELVLARRAAPDLAAGG